MNNIHDENCHCGTCWNARNGVTAHNLSENEKSVPEIGAIKVAHSVSSKKKPLSLNIALIMGALMLCIKALFYAFCILGSDVSPLAVFVLPLCVIGGGILRRSRVAALTALFAEAVEMILVLPIYLICLIGFENHISRDVSKLSVFGHWVYLQHFNAPLGGAFGIAQLTCVFIIICIGIGLFLQWSESGDSITDKASKDPYLKKYGM